MRDPAARFRRRFRVLIIMVRPAASIHDVEPAFCDSWPVSFNDKERTVGLSPNRRARLPSERPNRPCDSLESATFCELVAQ